MKVWGGSVLAKQNMISFANVIKIKVGMIGVLELLIDQDLIIHEIIKVKYIYG